MVLVYIIFCFYLTISLIFGIIYCVKFKRFANGVSKHVEDIRNLSVISAENIENQAKELKQFSEQMFGLLGGLAQENVANRKMVDGIINLIKDAREQVIAEETGRIKVKNEKGEEIWVEEDSDF